MSMNKAVDQLASRVKLLEQDIDRIAMYLANKYPDEATLLYKYPDERIE